MFIVKTRRIAAAGFGRVALSAGLSCLLAAGTCAAGQKEIEHSGPEKTIPRLEFRVLDVGPDHKPVKSFSYRYEVLSVAEKEPLSKDKTAYRSDDGILRISRPYPPYGRIRLWIDTVDSDRAATGYQSFSYQIDEQRKVAPPDIVLELQILITGAVLDAETGKPVAGAEVAPVQYAHPFSSFPDWAEAVRSDSAGKYRLVTSEAIGIAARCRGYDEKQEGGGRAFQEPQHWSFVPGHNLRQHEPAAGPDGFVLRLVPQSVKPETANTPRPEKNPLPPIRGQVLDQNGQPVQDCKVELQKNPDEHWQQLRGNTGT